MLKPLLVGELNPYGSSPEFALYPLPKGASGDRLCRIMGVSTRGYLKRFDRVNLCVGKWSFVAARSVAEKLKQEDRVFVLLGAKVCRAFGYDFTPFCVCGKVVILPHPSGRSRLWNGSESVGRARDALKKVLGAGSTMA